MIAVKKSNMSEYYLIGHTLTVLFSGVDQRLVQIHHQDQLFVPVESLLVFSAQLLCLLLEWMKGMNGVPENLSNHYFLWIITVLFNIHKYLLIKPLLPLIHICFNWGCRIYIELMNFQPNNGKCISVLFQKIISELLVSLKILQRLEQCAPKSNTHTHRL